MLTWLPGWIISPSRASARTECGSYHWQLASPQQPVGTHAFSKLRGKEVAAWTSKHSAGVCQHCGGPTGGSAVKESACQSRRHGFHPWIRKIPWKRKWQPIPVFLPEKSDGQRSLAGYSPWDSKRVGHDLVNKQYLKWLANKDLLYSTGDSAQCHVAAWMGGK